MPTPHTLEHFDSHARINRALWLAIAAVATLDIAWAATLGITFDVSRAQVFLYATFGCLLLSWCYRHLRRDDTIWLVGHVTAQIICATAALGVLSYLSAGLGFALRDQELIAIDRALGFDWLKWMSWVNEHPMVARIFTAAYFTSGPQIMLMVGALFLCRQALHIQRFVAAFMLAALLTIFFAAVFPAFGGYVHYNIDVASQFPNLHPAAARVHELPMGGMRDGTTRILAFPLEGIVTFPSFHSALAVVITYASWPLRRLFWPVATLNFIVLMSTPTDGGHYLTDIIGGVLCAAAAIALAQKIRFTPKGA